MNNIEAIRLKTGGFFYKENIFSHEMQTHYNVLKVVRFVKARQGRLMRTGEQFLTLLNNPMNFLNKYILLFLTFTSCEVLYCQETEQNSTYDSVIVANDLNIFNLTPIENIKKGKIFVCYNKRNISALYVATNGKFIKKWKAKKFKVQMNSNKFLITGSDTTSGAHRYKLLYDSIIISRTAILYQRKFFTKEKELLSSEVKIVIIDTTSLNARYFSCETSNSFNLNSYLKADEITTGGIKEICENNVTKGMNFQLEKMSSILKYKKKSLFWIMNNFFLEFYIAGL